MAMPTHLRKFHESAKAKASNPEPSAAELPQPETHRQWLVGLRKVSTPGSSPGMYQLIGSDGTEVMVLDRTPDLLEFASQGLLKAVRQLVKDIP